LPVCLPLRSLRSFTPAAACVTLYVPRSRCLHHAFVALRTRCDRLLRTCGSLPYPDLLHAHAVTAHTCCVYCHILHRLLLPLFTRSCVGATARLCVDFTAFCVARLRCTTHLPTVTLPLSFAISRVTYCCPLRVLPRLRLLLRSRFCLCATRLTRGCLPAARCLLDRCLCPTLRLHGYRRCQFARTLPFTLFRICPFAYHIPARSTFNVLPGCCADRLRVYRGRLRLRVPRSACVCHSTFIPPRTFTACCWITRCTGLLLPFLGWHAHCALLHVCAHPSRALPSSPDHTLRLVCTRFATPHACVCWITAAFGSRFCVLRSVAPLHTTHLPLRLRPSCGWIHLHCGYCVTTVTGAVTVRLRYLHHATYRAFAGSAFRGRWINALVLLLRSLLPTTAPPRLHWFALCHASYRVCVTLLRCRTLHYTHTWNYCIHVYFTRCYCVCYVLRALLPPALLYCRCDHVVAVAVYACWVDLRVSMPALFAVAPFALHTRSLPRLRCSTFTFCSARTFVPRSFAFAIVVICVACALRTLPALPLFCWIVCVITAYAFTTAAGSGLDGSDQFSRSLHAAPTYPSAPRTRTWFGSAFAYFGYYQRHTAFGQHTAVCWFSGYTAAAAVAARLGSRLPRIRTHAPYAAPFLPLHTVHATVLVGYTACVCTPFYHTRRAFCAFYRNVVAARLLPPPPLDVCVAFAPPRSSVAVAFALHCAGSGLPFHVAQIVARTQIRVHLRYAHATVERSFGATSWISVVRRSVLVAVCRLVTATTVATATLPRSLPVAAFCRLLPPDFTVLRIANMRSFYVTPLPRVHYALLPLPLFFVVRRCRALIVAIR